MANPQPQTLTYALTSLVEIQRLWSVPGVTLRLDDLTANNPDSDLTVETINEIIDQATQEVLMYIEGLYNASDLVNNTWTRRQATFIGAYYLSLRRGNPPYYEAEYERIIAKLERIKNGFLQIPGLPYKSDMTPAASNIHVNDNWVVDKIRVIPQISQGGTPKDANQSIEMYPWYFY